MVLEDRIMSGSGEGWRPFRRLMTWPLVILLTVVSASALLDLRRSNADYDQRTPVALPQMISPDDSPYSVAKGGVRNESMNARSYASTARAAIGDEFKFRFEISRSTPEDQEALQYIRLREAIADPTDQDLRTRSFGLSMVDDDGNESPIKGSKFELVLDDYDNCSHAGVFSVQEARELSGDASWSLDPVTYDLPKTYLSGTRPIFTAPVGFAGTRLQVEGVLSFRLQENSLSNSELSLDGGPVIKIRNLRTKGSEPQSVQSARLGDVVAVSMSLHRAICSLTKTSPVIRVTQSTGGGAGYVKLAADDVSGGHYETDNPVGTAVLSVVGVRRPWLREIPGSSRFWAATCGNPVVLEKLTDGVLSGGVQVGPISAFVPRDKCYTEQRWLTFSARVAERGR